MEKGRHLIDQMFAARDLESLDQPPEMTLRHQNLMISRPTTKYKHRFYKKKMEEYCKAASGGGGSRGETGIFCPCGRWATINYRTDGAGQKVCSLADKREYSFLKELCELRALTN